MKYFQTTSAVYLALLALTATIFGGFVYIEGVKLEVESKQFSEQVVLQKAKQIVEEKSLSEWKTYRNEEYGFEFEYSSDWIVNETLYRQGLPSEWFGVEFSKWDDGTVPMMLSFAFTTKHSEILEGGVRGETVLIKNSQDGRSLHKTIYYWDTPDYGERNVVYLDMETTMEETGRGRYVYRSNEREKVEIYEHVLSSFNFIESVDTSEWKIYRNEEYGFEFEYGRKHTLLESSPEYVELLNSFDAIGGSGTTITVHPASSIAKYLSDLNFSGTVVEGGEVVVNNTTWEKYLYIWEEPTHATSTHIWTAPLGGNTVVIRSWNSLEDNQVVRTIQSI